MTPENVNRKEKENRKLMLNASFSLFEHVPVAPPALDWTEYKKNWDEIPDVVAIGSPLDV